MVAKPIGMCDWVGCDHLSLSGDKLSYYALKYDLKYTH